MKGHLYMKCEKTLCNLKAPISFFNGRSIDLVEKWRSIGRLVFTNGCFDILHVGHINLLERSKALGDFLIVGLNSDNSVRSLKGNSRPINNENNRAYMLASLRSVDLVIIFDEETPKELLSIIKPSVLVKGSDYIEDQIIGREYANETIILPIIEGLSTTKILNRIRGE